MLPNIQAQNVDASHFYSMKIGCIPNTQNRPRKGKAYPRAKNTPFPLAFAFILSPSNIALQNGTSPNENISPKIAIK